MKENVILDIKTVSECNRCLGSETLHPQAGIVRLEKPELAGMAVKFEFYAILLIDKCPDGCCCCGRKYYDYSDATMVFLSPGEIFRMSGNVSLPDKGRLLAFHPDLLFRTSLKDRIGNYSFFCYGREEALHLSQRERATVACCLGHMEEELHHPIDTHTATILSRHIELLLDYCSRFYERQFITRESRNKALIERLDGVLDGYIVSGELQEGRFPTTEHCAMILGLSPVYFADLLRFETGKGLAEYFECRRLDAAKRMLLRSDDTPAMVACRLGFPNVQYFSRIFKKVTGVAPGEYRCSRN